LNGVEGARLRGGKKSIVDSLFYEEGKKDKAPYEDEREDVELDKLTSKLQEE
jgi:hypothetical protein